jgi:hypothetical protein
VRGASVLLQVVANQMSRVNSENKKEEERNQTRDQTLLLLLSSGKYIIQIDMSAASSFCHSVNSLIDLTTEIHKVMAMSSSKKKGETPSSKPTQVKWLGELFSDNQEKDNIWKEKREVSLIFAASEQNTSEKKVKAASLNTIVLLLILPNEDRNLNVEKFQRIFLYTYPTFCTPKLLFKKLAVEVIRCYWIHS